MPPTPGAQSTPSSDSARCHACAKPTSGEPCLPECTRVRAPSATVVVEVVPDGVILLDMIRSDEEGVDRFGPVPFDHADIDCGDCHTDQRFDRPPTCEECHEEDVTFPDQRPGPKVETGK